MRYTFLLILLVFLVTGTYFANAQMYEYRDEDGNIRFTDDLGNVPEEKRENIKRIREVPDYDTSAESQEPAPEEQETAREDNDSEETGADLVEQGDELRREQSELKEEFERIEEEKAALGDPPGEDTPGEEFEAYRDKVDAINTRIQAYQEKLKDHEERVKAYNARFEK